MTEISKDIKDRIKKLAEEVEENISDIDAVFDAVKAAIQMKQPWLLEVRLMNQTINVLEQHYQSKKRKKPSQLFFIPTGVFSKPKDQNKKMRDEIYKEWKEPHNHAKMIADGKVMFMKIGEKIINGETIDDLVAISGNHPYETEEVNGIKIVSDGKPWKPGDKIIPRNYPEEIVYGEGDDAESYENFNYGEELTHNWKITLFGLGYYSGTKDVKSKDPETGAVITKKVEKNTINDAVITKVDFGGDYADPKSPKFIVKQPIFFVPTIAKVFDKKYSNVLYIQSRAKSETGLEILQANEKFRLLDYEETKTDPESGQRIRVKKDGIITKVNKRITNQARKLCDYIESDAFDKEPKEKKKKVEEIYSLYSKFTMKDFIPIIDLNEIKKFHFDYKVLYDGKTGEIKKGDNGVWDETDLNSFAISECSYTGVYAAKDKPPKIVITDGSLPKDKSLFCKFPNGMIKDLPEGQVIVSIMTARGNQAYDSESEEWIEDPENAEPIPRVQGLKLLVKFKDLNVDKILADIL